jgi:hypothetical protein
MATLDDLRKFALSLPETKEGSHFHLVAFRVADKPFVSIEKNNTHAGFALDKPDITALVAQAPDVYQEVWQSSKYLIGIRVELKRISAKQLKHLVELAWRKKAPKKLVVKSRMS